MDLYFREFFDLWRKRKETEDLKSDRGFDEKNKLEEAVFCSFAVVRHDDQGACFCEHLCFLGIEEWIRAKLFYPSYSLSSSGKSLLQS